MEAKKREELNVHSCSHDGNMLVEEGGSKQRSESVLQIAGYKLHGVYWRKGRKFAKFHKDCSCCGRERVAGQDSKLRFVKTVRMAWRSCERGKLVRIGHVSLENIGVIV